MRREAARPGRRAACLENNHYLPLTDRKLRLHPTVQRKDEASALLQPVEADGETGQPRPHAPFSIRAAAGSCDSFGI